MLLLAFAAFLVVPLEREFPQGDSYCASVNDIQYCFPLFPCYFFHYYYIAVEEELLWRLKYSGGWRPLPVSTSISAPCLLDMLTTWCQYCYCTSSSNTTGTGSVHQLCHITYWKTMHSLPPAPWKWNVWNTLPFCYRLYVQDWNIQLLSNLIEGNFNKNTNNWHLARTLEKRT